MAEEGEKDGGKGGPKNHRKYRREKPWDNDTIDHWKQPEWKEDEMKTQLLEESSFATLFPKYREKYLREIWPIVTKALEKHGVGCELDLVEGSMSVSTTKKVRDPYVIIKARDLMKLLARSIPVTQALKILEDDVNCDIIKIGGMVRNKERFVKRRQRLVGPDGATLKALELVTGCYILVQGNTVSCMGPYQGLKHARKVITDCMNNIHPVYNIKTLMIRRELAKDPALAGEDWSRFLPSFTKHKNVKRRRPQVVREKKTYTPFPPAQTPSKVDLELETGEYFLKEQQRKTQKRNERRAASMAAADEKKKARADARRAVPAETQAPPKAKGSNKKEKGEELSRMAAKFVSSGAEAVKKKKVGARTVSDFVETGGEEQTRKKKRKSDVEEEL